MRISYRVSTFLILALGIVHICMTPILFGGFTLNALWFASGGVMIVFVSFFNFMRMSDAGRERLVRILCYAANLTGLVFACAMLILESRRAHPGLSAWFVLAVLVFQTFAAFRYSPQQSDDRRTPPDKKNAFPIS